MPYQGTSGPGGPPAPSSTTMQVEPEKILDLMARYRYVRNTVQNFLYLQGDSLRARPLAQDEVSGDAAGAFNGHSTLALDVTKQFLVELNSNIEQLHSAARTYGLVEHDNADGMRKLHGSIDR